MGQTDVACQEAQRKSPSVPYPSFGQLVFELRANLQGLVGTDLLGNKYYEIPTSFGRPKRFVEYAEPGTEGSKERMINSGNYSNRLEYRLGTQQLPVQWTAWMSFTRANPPTMDELKRDYVRQERLRQRVAEIEERERLERIEQGYLNPDGSEIDPDRLEAPRDLQPKIGGPKGAKGAYSYAGAGKPSSYASQKPSVAQARGFDLPPSAVQEASKAMGQESYLAPPREKVDAAQHDDADELRRLAMEDTKRRMEESGVTEHREQEDVQGLGQGFKPAPRRRG